MADLAKLIVRLEMQSSQLVTELDKANGKLAGFEKSTSAALARLDKRFRGFGSGIKSALGILAGALSFHAIVEASAEAAKNFALLENAVTQAGDAAGGRTAQDFARVSKELQNITTYSDDSIQNVQQLLLRFQSIRTDRFDDATKAVLNLSAALGTDLDGAAKLIGKSLSDPEKGMTALAKAGVVLSDSQKKVIKDLTDAGKSAEAQGVLLDALQKKFGGAAEAARGNFSGALSGVRNSLNDLMEVDGGLPGATASLNELSKVLQDPAVKAGADALFSVIIQGAASAAEFMGKLIAGLAILAGKGSNELVNLDQKILDASASLESFKKNNPFADKFGTEQIAKMSAELKVMTDQYQKLLDASGAKPAAASTAPSPLQNLIEDSDGATAASLALQRQLEATGKSLTESLQTPSEKYQAAVDQADKLLAAHVITLETYARAMVGARDELNHLSTQLLDVKDRWEELNPTIDQALEKFRKGVGDEIQKDLEAGNEAMLKKLDESTKDADKKLSVFAEQAARNTQDILATGLKSALHDGIGKGAEGALDAFANMLEEMALQAIAADIAGKIFGEDGTGGLLGGLLGGKGKSPGTDSGSGGGILDTIGGFLGGLFSRDSGGRGQAGVPVMIGTGAQPEMYVPDSAGEFFPAGSHGGSVTQNIYTSSPITQRSARQIELEAAKRQRIATARLG